jgi:hypothetical protein
LTNLGKTSTLPEGGGSGLALSSAAVITGGAITPRTSAAITISHPVAVFMVSPEVRQDVSAWTVAKVATGF